VCMSKFGSKLEQFIYFGIAALLVWVPFPLASNRPYLRSLIVCWVLALAMLWLLGWIAGEFARDDEAFDGWI